MKYIVIDEFHAFIGTERGFHLISLLNRLDTLLQQNQELIPRVALSATLGNLEEVSKLLRLTEALPCSIITSKLSQSTLQLKIFGYKETIPLSEEDLNNTTEYEICSDLYNICRGDSHLIFANSRARTEKIAVILSDLCKQNGVPNEFFPYHGSLLPTLILAMKRLLKHTKEDGT